MHGIITTPKSERVFVEHVFGGGRLSSATQGPIGFDSITPQVLQLRA